MRERTPEEKLTGHMATAQVPGTGRRAKTGTGVQAAGGVLRPGQP